MIDALFLVQAAQPYGDFPLIGGRERFDIVARMKVRDVLQRIGNAFDEVFMSDYGHVSL